MAARALYATQNSALEWRDLAELEPRSHEVVITVAAAGVNRPDLLQRAGLYPPPPGASEAMGLEVAGTVKAVGDRVSRFRIGDRVMALVPGGGYATQCLAEEGSVMPLPKGLSMAEGAAFPETAFTVWANVFEAGRLAAGERLFVHGATSGIGTMAAAIASARGHEVYGTAGSSEKVGFAENHGFTKVWNYKNEPWDSEMTGLGGTNVVLDMVGGAYVARNLAMLCDGGRHVSIAFQAGLEASVNLMDIMRRRLMLTGSTLRARSKEEKSRLRAEVEAHLFPLVETGKLKPLVSLETPIDRADDAHQAMQSGALIGKAVLILPGETGT